MIPLSKFKEKLGESANNLSDCEIEKVRDLQYQFADVLFDMWVKDKSKLTVNKDKNNFF